MRLEFPYIIAIFTLSEAVNWQTELKQAFNLKRVFVNWRPYSTIQSPVYYRPTISPPRIRYTFLLTTTTRPPPPASIDDIAFLQETDSRESTESEAETATTIATPTETATAAFVTSKPEVKKTEEASKDHLFGIPFSIKIMKAEPTRLTTSRVRWRTVPVPATTTSLPSISSASEIRNEMSNMREMMEKSETIEDMEMICKNARRLGNAYGIHDMPSFARKNCPLIRLYYPYATCEKVVEIVDYCFLHVKPSEAQPFVRM